MQPALAPKNNVEQAIRQCGLFDDLSQTSLAHFVQSATTITLKKKGIIFLQDDRAEFFYLILQGWIKMFRETLDGTEVVIDILSDGQLVGETAIFEDTIHNFSAEAAEKATLLRIPTQILKQVIESEHQMALNMIQNITQKHLRQTHEIEHLNIQNASQRLGCFLLRLCPDANKKTAKIQLPYDKTLIASRLGMKPETFSRALAKLKAETDIEINNNMVQVNNQQSLVHYTCNHCSGSFPCQNNE